MNKKRYIPIRQKLILLCILVLSIPLLTIGGLTYNKYMKSMESETTLYLEQISQQINTNLDGYIREINKLTIAPLYEMEIMDILRNHKSRPVPPNSLVVSSETTRVSLFLHSAGFDRPEIENVSLYTSDNILFSSQNITGGYEFVDPIDRESFGVRLTELGIYLHSPQEVNLNGKNQIATTVTRELLDPYTREPLGWIRIRLNEEMFDNIITTPKSNYQNKLWVTDIEGNVFYPVDRQLSMLPFKPDLRFQMDGDVYRCFSNMSKVTGMIVHQIIAEKDLYGDADQLVGFTAMLSLAAVSVAITIAALMAYRITKPIDVLSDKMAQVETGEFNTRIEITSNDELGRLSNGFNQMVERIEQLVNDNYEMGLRKNEADLIALLHQIDPHFLYNTLEMINMMALENRQFEISDTVSSLGRMLRYTVSNRRSHIALREELQFTRAYLQILRLRQGETLDAGIDCPDDLEGCMVPKLMLQPLVENAFIHGLQSGGGVIRITVEREEEDLLLRVSDNGIGMTDLEIERLLATIKNPPEPQVPEAYGMNTHGLALGNIYRRLLLEYGSDSGFHLESEQNVGTTVEVRLPYYIPSVGVVEGDES